LQSDQVTESLLTESESDLFGIMTGAFRAQLLSVALKRDLFTYLSSKSLKLGQLCEHLKIPRKPCLLFLESLVAIKLLKKTGEYYGNSSMSATYLVKGRPEYQGANVKLFESLYDACRELETALVEDKPTTTNFAYFFDDGDDISSDYANLMHESGVVPTLLLMEYYDFSDSKWLLDVGGGSGRLAATLTSQYSGLGVVLFDLPQICAQAQDYLTPFPSLSSRIEIFNGNFLRDSFPEGPDTILMMRIVHDWPDDTAQLLLRKAYKALPPGGKILIYETMRTSDDVPDETFAISLLMQLISPAGKIRSFNEVSDMLREARFTNIEVTPTAYMYTLVSAEKPLTNI
jgi:3-hydroxy-5-methyl-1-naphthoate 3-O-methyltransferase